MSCSAQTDDVIGRHILADRRSSEVLVPPSSLVEVSCTFVTGWPMMLVLPMTVVLSVLFPFVDVHLAPACRERRRKRRVRRCSRDNEIPAARPTDFYGYEIPSILRVRCEREA